MRWLSSRAVVLHAALAVALPLCGVAAWWQVHRALTGNTLSWLYVLEWPAFGGIAVWLWWVLLTGPGRTPSAFPAPRVQSDLLAQRTAPVHWRASEEAAELRAYNSFLSEINAGRAAARPRPRRRRPAGTGRRSAGAVR